MGFRKGDCLGKDGTGRTEPIPIGIHTGRKGLGGTGKRESMHFLHGDHVKQGDPIRADVFLDSKKNAFEASQMQRELDAARRICKSLDLECGIRQPDAWITPDELQQSTEDAAAFEASSPAFNLSPASSHCDEYPLTNSLNRQFFVEYDFVAAGTA
jgi:hypothetical protein